MFLFRCRSEKTKNCEMSPFSDHIALSDTLPRANLGKGGRGPGHPGARAPSLLLGQTGHTYLLNSVLRFDSISWPLTLNGFLNFALLRPWPSVLDPLRSTFDGARVNIGLGLRAVYMLTSKSSSTASSSAFLFWPGGRKGFFVLADCCELSSSPERFFWTSYPVFPLLLMTEWPNDDVVTGVRESDSISTSSPDLPSDPRSKTWKKSRIESVAYRRNSSKRPPKMRRLSGRLREVVVYEKRTTGAGLQFPKRCPNTSALWNFGYSKYLLL